MATATPVSVFARVRPLLRTGDTAVTVQHQHSISADGSALAVPRGIVLSGGSAGRQHSFEFTRVFAAEAPQEEVYREAVKPLVQAFLSGVSGTAMAYGQTGSGKTYTMLGGSKYKTRGLIPRAINDVFASLDREEKAAAAAALAAAAPAAPVSDSVAGGADAPPPGDAGAGAGCKLLCAYTQVYNETLYDLLEEGNADKPIELWDRVRVQEGRDGALLLSNLRQFEVPTERDALNLMFLGNVRRMTAETPMNAASSRSHCIFTLTLERSLPDGRLRTSKLHLVDLAGSERIPGAGPTILTDDAALLLASGPSSRRSSGVAASLGGPQPGAGHQRNLSRLSAGGPGFGGGPGSISSAGRASAAPQAAVHVPYRNSVLTSVLRDSLGGNCRTVLVATLNPEPDYAEESLSTCRFAARCGMLVNAVSAREEETAASAAAEQRALVAAYKSRVRELLAALDRQSVATSERDAALREAASALLRAGQELPPSLSLALAGADNGGGATPTAGGSASGGSVLDCASPVGSVSAASVPLHALGPQPRLAGSPSPCSKCASAAAAAPPPAPVPDAARRHEIEAGVAACIRAGLDPDLHPGAEGAAGAEGLHAVVAQHLSLRSVPEGYAASELLLQALQRAVAAAGEASSEADHARAQAKALQAAVASLQGVAARLQRDCGDWETRHAGLLGEFAVMQRATAALTAQVVELQAQLAQSTDRAAAAQASAASAVAERDAARAAAADANQRLAAAATAAASAAETARPRVHVSASGAESVSSSASAAEAGSAHNAAEGAGTSDAAAEDPPLSGRGAEGATAQPQAQGAVPSETREGTLKTAEPGASGSRFPASAVPQAPLLTAPPPEPAIASASRASATAVRQLLLAGGLFMKHGRRGAPHMRFVWCDGDLLAVHWTAVDTAGRSAAGPAASAASSSSSAGRGSLLLSSVCEVVAGRRTAVFGRGSGGRTGRDAACFSLVAPDRTLDLEVALPDSYAYAGALAAGGALGGLSSPSARKEQEGDEEGQGLQSGAGALPQAVGVDAAVSAAEAALRDRWVKAFRIVIAARRKLEKGLPSPSGGVSSRA